MDQLFIYVKNAYAEYSLVQDKELLSEQAGTPKPL
jgi:hypothetical protein